MSDVKNLSPQEAADLMKENPKTILLDVRTTIEHNFVGHPVGSIHIPWMDAPDWQVNSTFVEDVLAVASIRDANAPKTVPLVLMCRSGQRSIPSSQLLMEQGFTNVAHIGEGFEGDLDESGHRGTTGGWRFRGLPWAQT